MTRAHNPTRDSTAKRQRMLGVTRTDRPTARMRGSAMLETVLIVPLLIVVLALLIFFGRGWVRVQHAAVVDRYDAWRYVASAEDNFGDPWGPHTTGELNDAFFGGNAQWVSRTGRNDFPPDAPNELIIRTAMNYSFDAATLLERIFDDLPSGRSVQMTVSYDEDVPLFEPMNEPISRSHVRMGNDWRFLNGLREQDDGQWRPRGERVSLHRSVVDEFFTGFDDRMRFLADSGNDYAAIARRFYTQQPGYAGPDVP